MDKWTPDFWVANEDECKKKLMEPGNWEKVPLLSNESAFGTLVRFKGMIQDLLNPEFYFKTFSVLNLATNETRHCQGKYHSCIINQLEEEVQLADDFMERQIAACIPIPGLNDWVKEADGSADCNKIEVEENSNKRIRLDPASQNNSKEVLIFAYPEDLESNGVKLMVNNIIEIVGFLDQRSVQSDNEDTEESSSVPKETRCIHAVQFKISPILPISEEIKEHIWDLASYLHAELKLVLTQALLGDTFTADYLLFYLVSTIYNRKDNEVPGKFALNIRGIPNNKTYVKKLYSFISNLVEKSEYLPITIDNLNSSDMIPRKCYSSNRLLNGLLQLTNRTHLVLDETDLQPGPLDNKGILNIQALTDIISDQKLKYDFTYYTIDYQTEISVLTLSVGKSLLPCDINVVLRPDPSHSNNMDVMIDSAFTYLNSQPLLLEKLRKYISIISTFPFYFNENILKVIENDYVEMRKKNAENISPKDLHRFMMLSKLIALCSGKNELTDEVWLECKTLEARRLIRNNI